MELIDSSLTDKKYWHKNFGDPDFFYFGGSSYGKYLNKYLDIDPNKTCIEIGAFPGGNLGYLAKTFHFKPTALDFVDNIDFIRKNMEYNNINECEIISEDFLKWESEMKYDVVCSHGFIEHFVNYEEVLQKHIDILENNGTLIITVPYLDYFQLWVRQILYTERKYKETMAVHNKEVMNIDILKEIIFKRNKLSKQFVGFVRGMEIWFPANEGTIQMDKIRIYNFIKKLERIVNALKISNRFISPEILIIAKK